jgi:hypothetical protein
LLHGPRYPPQGQMSRIQMSDLTCPSGWHRASAATTEVNPESCHLEAWCGACGVPRTLWALGFPLQCSCFGVETTVRTPTSGCQDSGSRFFPRCSIWLHISYIIHSYGVKS